MNCGQSSPSVNLLRILPPMAAGRPKDAGELSIRLHRAKFDPPGVRQDERLRRKAVAGRQTLDQFSRM
jgi:hypothetical protein